MKKILSTVLALGFMLPLGAMQAAAASTRKAVNKDVKEHKGDSPELRRERLALKDARGDYYQAVHEHGLSSPEAKAAKEKMLRTQETLHEEQQEEQQEQRQDRGDTAERSGK